jgi:cytochrome c553
VRPAPNTGAVSDMNNSFILGVFLATSMALAGLPAWAAGDAAAGKTKASTCAGCHGIDGNSVNPEWPSLASQNAGYLVKQLKDFKSGDRQNATMAPMAAALSDQDMEDISAYLATQTVKGGAADPALAVLGQSIYRGGIKDRSIPACMSCHAPDGKGTPAAKFPRIAGQHAAYTVNQLKAFRSSARNNDAAQMMRDTAHLMTDDEIVAVSSYMQGLH